jgi:membrane protease YdiL (CAAX protease family)
VSIEQKTEFPALIPVRAIAVGIAVTIAAAWVPQIDVMRALGALLADSVGLSPRAAGDCALFIFGACLALSNPRQSGMRLGAIREHWKRVAIVCALPVVITAIVYPMLPERPFARAGIEMWTLSPIAQDLVFAGFLYGWLERLVPGTISSHVRINRALVLAALCFAGWHLQNFGSAASNAYVIFQLAYTAVGFLLTGLSRQWTGSFLYLTMSHAAVNYIAWLTS